MKMYPTRSPLVQPAPRYPVPVYPRPQPSYGYPQYVPRPYYASNLAQPSSSFQSYPGPYGTSSFESNSSSVRIWMPAPLPSPSCPPGLEYLTQIDRLLIHQQLELLEVITSFETCNKYEIKNALGETMYFAFEENDCCTLNCCGAARPFIMKIVDNTGQEIIELIRPLRCSSCCCPCCLQELFVHAPPGNPVGCVKQIWDPCLPRLAIQNAAERDMLRIVGPCFVCSCGGDVNFEVMSVDELHTVGRVSKYWTGLMREVFTDADDIGVQFPQDLDVKMKAVMLGACFLIDFMFFEHATFDRHSRVGVW